MLCFALENDKDRPMTPTWEDGGSCSNDSCRQESHPRVMALPPRPSEAIAVILPALPVADCEVDRLRALYMRTSRDLWLLIDGKHGPFINVTEWVQQHFGNDSTRIFVDAPGDSMPAAVRCALDGCYNKSRHMAGTGVFLSWLASSEYSHAWHVEMDTLYSGCWSHFFDEFASWPAHLIAKREPAHQGWRWSQPQRCHLGLKRRKDSATIVKRFCVASQVTKTFWQVLRLSHWLASEIINELRAPDGMRAYHEALVGLVCSHRPGCFARTLPPHRTAAQKMASLGPRYNTVHAMNFTPAALAQLHEPSGHVQPNALYHPTKCSTSQEIGRQALQYCKSRTEHRLRRRAEVGRTRQN